MIELTKTLELSKDELVYINMGLDKLDSVPRDLKRMIIDGIMELEELDGMDFNDCGDACKL